MSRAGLVLPTWPPRSAKRKWLSVRGGLFWGFTICGFCLLLLLALPLVALLWQAVQTDFLTHLASPQAQQALMLSVMTSAGATMVACLVGTPLAYIQARWRFPLHSWVSTLIDLPIVLPPSVAGLALLMAFGRQGLVGSWLSTVGLGLPFTTAAVLIAQIFVAAPLFIRATRLGFQAIDPQLEEAALTEGATENQLFQMVMLPLNAKPMISGAILCWARALGEFGATLLFAGNLPGRTQTMPLAIFVSMERDIDVAVVLAAILIATSAVVLQSLSRLANNRA